MEHIKNFAKLAENLSAKFSDLDEFYLYIHILGYVSGFDNPLFFNCHLGIAPIVSHFTFDKAILQKIKESFPFSVNQLSEEEKKELCKYFLEICLQFERRVEKSPDYFVKFASNLLASNEPQPKSSDISDFHFKSGSFSFAWSELSAKSQKKFVDWDIERYFYYKTPRVPKQVNETIVTLADLKSGRTVYDPNCGDGSLFVEFYNKFSDSDFNFNGVVGNQYERLFCLVNFYVNGILDDRRIEVEIEVSSPLEDTPQWYYEMKSGEAYSLREIADIAVSFVPSKRKLTKGELDSRFFGLSYSLEQPEYAYIELMLNAVRDTGKAIAIVPDSVLYSSEGRFFREAYLSRDWIESVISLDKVDFNLDTFADASIVVFNKHKSNKDIVSFKGNLGNTEVKTSIIKSEYDSCLKVTFFLDVKKQLEYIAKAFSTEFPDLAPFRYLYIIAGLTDNILNKQFLSFFPVILLSEFFSRESISIFTQDQTKEAIEYLVSKIFQSLNSIFPLSHRSWDEIIDDLANREPEAVQIETTPSGEKIENIDWSKLSYSALNEFTQREIHSALQNPQYLFPSKELDRTLVELADPKTDQIIYNPNCGVGSVFVEFEKQYPNHNLKYYGILSDNFSELLCNANLYINGINAEINNEILYSKNRSFNEKLSEWQEVSSNEISLYDEESSEWQSTNIVDIAVGIPGFTERVYLGKYKPEKQPSRKNFTRNEYALVEEMLSRLNETGKAIVVVPNSFLFSSHGKSYRQKYLSLDLIEKVISLPDDTYKSQGSIKTSIIVFNKNKSNKNTILFDGKDDRLEETQIRVDSIISENKTNLRPIRYALKEGKELRNIFAHSHYPIKKIKDLIDFSILGSNPSSKSKLVEKSSENLPFVRVTDLSKNDKDFELDISKIERKISLQKARKVIDFDVVLVNKIGTKLKPTRFKYEGKPIVIGSDVIALKIKADVNIEYFITQLYSRIVQIQVEMLSSGNIINRISKEDFLNIQIILPPLEEQQRQVLEMRGVIEEKAIAEEKLIDAQFDVVASINHSLKNKLAVIINDYDTLVRFLRRKERKIETIMFSDPISANAIGDDIDTIEIITNRLKTNLSDASKVFNNALKIQRQNLKKDVVELVKFFKEDVKSLYIGKNFSIEIIAKPNLKLNVWLDKDAFKDVIENLIENAKSHGFVDNEKNYRIVFDLSKLKDEEGFDEQTSTKYARIVYKNDGKPFPKNFSFEDYKQFSNKSGKTQGTGIGGYVINKIIELHDGRFNFTSPSDDFTVEFEILLPLEN